MFTSEDDPGKKIGSLPRGVDNMKINGNTTVSWIAEVDHEATHDSEKSNLNWAQGKLNSALSIFSKMQKSILIKHAFTLLRERRPRPFDKYW